MAAYLARVRLPHAHPTGRHPSALPSRNDG